MRVVVTGYMVRHPVAGNILAFFSYLVGLRELGHDVVYIEESGWANSCYDPVAKTYGDNPENGLRILTTLFKAEGVNVPRYYVNRDTGTVHGGTWDDVKQSLSAADILINIGGVCWLPEFSRCPRRILIDMDPLFTQAGRFGMGAIPEHHMHFSYGMNIGQTACTVPTAGIDWIPTVPPVVTAMWPVAGTPAGARFTTVANWSGYSGIEHNGEYYGQKDEEFMRLLELPGVTSQVLEIAVSGMPTEVANRFKAQGWKLRDAGEISREIDTYQTYLRNSLGEFSVAKNGYVKTWSGWFSDRSVCYLAAGRPVVLQDTGFTDWLPAGRGVLGFTTLDEAVEKLEQVSDKYEEHRISARQIATEVFEARTVVARLLELAVAGTDRSRIS